MAKLRVMTVDDSVMIRRMISDVLALEPDIELAGSAPNGRFALALLPKVNPDLILLDVEMPEMNGIDTLRELRKRDPHIPVLMFSMLTSHGAAATLDALAAGANDYVAKPREGGAKISMNKIREEIVPRIKALCEKNARRKQTATGVLFTDAPVRAARPPRRITPIELVVIAVSTGGPNALAEIIPALPADFPVPVLIVQHMPAEFTGLLADRLHGKSQMRVKLAAQGDVPEAGWVYLAPGDHHLGVNAGPTGPTLSLNQDPPENSVRPSGDVLFRSAAAVLGPATLGVVLTGMGRDGYLGALEIYQAHGRVLVQDEASSVVWGMPGAVAQARIAEQILPLERIAAGICEVVESSRRQQPGPPAVVAAS